MNRIFTSLASLAVMLMLATLMLGLGLRAVDIRDGADHQAQAWATTHRLAGICVGLVVLLVDSFVVTYFIGTSRWAREVVDAYQLDPQLTRKSNLLKRRTFPLAVGSMLTVVGVVALGGAADPAARLRLRILGDVTWTQLHLAGASLGLCLIAWSFFRQWQYIEAHRRVIDEIVGEVRRIRQQRGLPVDDEERAQA